MPADEDTPPRDLDIAKPAAKRPRPRQTSWFWLWMLILALAIVGLGERWRGGGRAAWAVVLVPLLVVALVVWQVFRLGVLTWMRQAQAPGKALARGDAAGAERAFAGALARARRFPPDDHRRGTMMALLADYPKRLGRPSEAKALFEEGVEILGRHRKTKPVEYFIALNNHAVFLIDVEDFAAAQRILEQLLDLVLVWGKGGLDVPLPVDPWAELAPHLNLVRLFVRMEEMDLAADHLEEAETFFGKLVKPQTPAADCYHGVRAFLRHAQKRFAAADDELHEIRDQEDLMCLSVRAKLCLTRGDFSQAEQLLRKYLGLAGKYGSRHRPDVREQALDLAESLFGGGKPDEAFDALEEARAITRDFALPATPAWRRALADWLRRAHDSGRTADAARLEAELQALAVSPEQAITVSPRFQLRRPG